MEGMAMKILIAVPSMDQVPVQFRQSLAMLQKVGDVALSFQVSSLIYTARDALAKTAIDMGADYIFWLDSDMVFPPDTLVKMLETMKEKGLDILTGVYFKRMAPYRPVLYDEMNEDGTVYTEFKDIPDGLFEVGGCGFGCVLMKTSVVIDVLATHLAMFTPMARAGEDIAFCCRRRSCGYKIIADPSIPLGHVGHRTITRDFYEALKPQN